MDTTVRVASPGRQAQPAKDTPMVLTTPFVLPETPVSDITYRAPVLLWGPDGRAEGLLTQQLDDEIRGELAALDVRPPWDNSPLTSGLCTRRWPAEIGGEYMCSLTPGHDPGHEAWAPDGEVVSRHTEPVPKPRRKPSPRPRAKTAEVKAS